MDQQTSDLARFFELVSGVQVRTRRTIEAGLRGRGLTYAQYTALAALDARNGMSQAELAQALDTDSTTAMVLRTSLEKKGYVDRVDDPDDGRVKRIVITDSGKTALHSAAPETRSFYSKASAVLSDPEVKRMLPALQRIHEFLGETSASKKEVASEGRKKGQARKEGAKAAKGKAAASKKGPKAKTAAKAPSKAAKSVRGKAKTAKPAARKAK
mgnify:CR=1 FL=1